MVNLSAAETGQGDRGIVWIVEEIILRRKDVVEREGRVVVYLLIVGERWGRVAGPDGGRLTVEFYKSATTPARDTLGYGMGELLECSGS
jgi:hypothetical protein